MGLASYWNGIRSLTINLKYELFSWLMLFKRALTVDTLKNYVMVGLLYTVYMIHVCMYLYIYI